MLVGGRCIDDTDRLRSGASGAVLPFEVVAPSTAGTFLRSFTFGHVRQLDKAAELGLRRAWSVGAAPDAGEMTVDLDSTVCEVCGKAKHGAAYGHTGVLGYHPLVAVRSDTGEVLHSRMRSGSSQRGNVRFARETLARGIITLSDKAEVRTHIRCHTPVGSCRHDHTAKDGDEEGPGQALAQGPDTGGTDPQVPRRQDGRGVVRRHPLARRPAVPALRPRQHPAPDGPQNDALPVPPQRLPQVLQREGRHRDAGLEARLPGVGHNCLPVQHVPQGRVVDEAAPRPGHQPEVGVAPGAPHPPVLGRPQQRAVRRTGRGGRDLPSAGWPRTCTPSSAGSVSTAAAGWTRRLWPGSRTERAAR